jgi:cytosine/adenosine deaminase-related metal-dependent hydrolase
LILVHNVATKEEDVRAVKTAEGPSLFYCLCPNANEYISGSLPDVEMLIREECTIVLGTDSLASNHRLSILEEIKTLRRAFPRIGISEMLRWATYNGAKALQLDSVLGSFEKGKQPGVILIEKDGETVRRLL